MNTDRLFRVLSVIRPLHSDCQEALKSVLKFVNFPKGHYLVQANTPAQHVYFLEEGFSVAFQYQGHKRVVTDMWQPGDIILSPKSFFEQMATEEIIQLTIDSRLFSLSYTSLNRLLERFPAANVLARDITADYYARSEERIVDIHTLDAWSRYLKLLRMYPGIELNISQDLIASYLGITPQSLSRLKPERS